MDYTAAKPDAAADPLPAIVSLETWPPVELASGWALGDADRVPYFKRGNWPHRESLEYTKLAITVGLLVLALPYLLRKLATDPGDLIAATGRKAVGRAGSG